MSKYTRKTTDEWTLQGLYPSTGWEDLTTETTKAEIKARWKEYSENEGATPYRIIKRRVPVSPSVA